MCNAFCCRSNSSKYTPKCSIPLLLEINVIWTQTQLFFIEKQLKKTKHKFKLLQNKNTLFSLLYVFMETFAVTFSQKNPGSYEFEMTSN